MKIVYFQQIFIENGLIFLLNILPESTAIIFRKNILQSERPKMSFFGPFWFQ
jgi:hypothetical protein